MNEFREALRVKFNPVTWNGWRAFKDYQYAGINLIDEVNALNPDLVIEAGCGHNRFKGHIKNLIGFDQEPFPFADIHMGIDDIQFRPESADVVLCLGSVQFGSRALVERHITKILSWVKPGGFIVMRTLYERNREPSHRRVHYIWSQEDVEYFTQKFNLSITKGPNLDHTGWLGNSNRLVWWWQKPGTRLHYTIDPITCVLSHE